MYIISARLSRLTSDDDIIYDVDCGRRSGYKTAVETYSSFFLFYRPFFPVTRWIIREKIIIVFSRFSVLTLQLYSLMNILCF